MITKDNVILALATDNTCLNVLLEPQVIQPSGLLWFGVDKDFPFIPTIARTPTIERSGKTGYGAKRIDMTLTGFFETKNHTEAARIYQKFESIIHQSYAYLTYKVGDHTIANNQIVYIDGATEPDGWKQYYCKYTINLHYYPHDCDGNINDLKCSFVQIPPEVFPTIDFKNLPVIANTYEQPAPEFDDDGNPIQPEYPGAYIFASTPNWTRNTKYGGKIPATQIAPTGKTIARKISVDLRGVLRGKTRTDIKDRMDELETAFRYAGILNYGDWSMVYYPSGGVSFPDNMPDMIAPFVIKGLTYDSELYELEAEVSYTRTHKHPLIKTRKYCYTTEVYEFHESGQTVNYKLTVKGSNRPQTRQLAADEFKALVIPNGTEMPGGRERWKADGSIVITANHYYKDAPLLNIDYSSGIADSVFKG